MSEKLWSWTDVPTFKTRSLADCKAVVAAARMLYAVAFCQWISKFAELPINLAGAVRFRWWCQDQNTGDMSCNPRITPSWRLVPNSRDRAGDSWRVRRVKLVITPQTPLYTLHLYLNETSPDVSWRQPRLTSPDLGYLSDADELVLRILTSSLTVDRW